MCWSLVALGLEVSPSFLKKAIMAPIYLQANIISIEANLIDISMPMWLCFLFILFYN
jgi:hypothetical protein